MQTKLSQQASRCDCRTRELIYLTISSGGIDGDECAGCHAEIQNAGEELGGEVLSQFTSKKDGESDQPDHGYVLPMFT